MLLNKQKAKETVIKFAVLLFWIGVWQLAFTVIGQKYGEILLVSPLRVMERLSELMKTSSFWIDTLTSLLRVSCGYLLGVISAIFVAVITSKSRFFAALLTPVLSLVKTTPVTSFILIALVWLKKDSVAVFISFLMVLPMMWANITKGIDETDRGLLEMARVFSFSPAKKLRMIYIPSVMPYFIAGCTTALGFAWKAGVAAEVLSTPLKSIGYNLYRSKINIETADLFAWTTVVIILSVIFEKAVVLLLRHFSPEKEADND